MIRGEPAIYTPMSFGTEDSSRTRVVLVEKIERYYARVRDSEGSSVYVVPIDRLKLDEG